MISRLMIALLALWCTFTLHAEEERPKIGVVLGGGGALGFAHIGVLKALEEYQIPVDYIAGTSMGAIIAAMYASGMSPEEMEKEFLSMDWWEVLEDQSPHQYLVYRRKVDNKRFMGLEFGIKDGGLAFAPGMAYGQKLNNVLSTFTINSAGIRDFDQLNIPYRAVATDLRSGQSVVLKSGSLATAMRASMAVPGAFTPVELDGMILVDGGVLNNIPVDVVKEMGADIVIAVDVGASTAAKTEQGDFNMLGDVVTRTYTIIQRPDQDRQLTMADLVIAPDLMDATPSQFHRADEIIPTGYAAASAKSNELVPLGVEEETYRTFLARQRQQRAKELYISGIRIQGNTGVPEESVRNRIRSQPGPINLNTVYEDLNRIYGMGHFQTVTYELLPDGEGTQELVYRPDDKFWGPNYLHFGLQLETASDTAMIWSMLANYTRTQLNPSGGEVSIDMEAGGHTRLLDCEWYQPFAPGGTLFFAPSTLLYTRDITLYDGDTVIADIDEYYAGAEADLGLSAFEYGELRAGVLIADARADGNAGPIDLGDEHNTIVAATSALRLDQLNHPYFPTEGYRIEVDGMFAFEEAGSTRDFSRLEAMLEIPVSYSRHTLTPRAFAGSAFGTELPFAALFDVGGLDSFAGYAPFQLFGQYYAVGQLEYRFRLLQLPPTLGDGLYTILRYDAGNAWIYKDDVTWDDINHAGLAGLAADTALGTIRIAVGKAEGLNPRFYFSFGNVF